MENSFATMALKALDGLTARSEVTAENIANAGTPGYRPLRLDFEQALIQAASRGEDAVRKLSFAPQAIQATLPGDELRLDLELQTASATALRYSALIDVLDRQTQLQALAIKGVM